MSAASDLYHDVKNQFPPSLVERVDAIPKLEVAAYLGFSALAWRRDHKVLAMGLAMGGAIMAMPERPIHRPQTAESP